MYIFKIRRIGFRRIGKTPVCSVQEWVNLASSDNMCAVPRTHNSFGNRSFGAVSPRIWNSLPCCLRTLDISYKHFKALLKTYVFRRRFVTFYMKYSYLLTHLLTQQRLEETAVTIPHRTPKPQKTTAPDPTKLGEGSSKPCQTTAAQVPSTYG